MFDSEKLIVIQPRKVVIFLASTVFILALCGAGSQITKYVGGHEKVFGLIRMFNLDEENNIPTFFSTASLLTIAILLAIISVFKKYRQDSFALHWKIAAILFFLFALDEAASIHELLIVPMRLLFHAKGIFYFAWVIPAIFSLAILSLAYIKFFIHLSKKAKKLLLVAATLFLGGGLGFELLDGWYAFNYGTKNFGYGLLTTAEESLEMAGMVMIIYVLLRYISANIHDMRICYKDANFP